MSVPVPDKGFKFFPVFSLSNSHLRVDDEENEYNFSSCKTCDAGMNRQERMNSAKIQGVISTRTEQSFWVESRLLTLL